jgi:hypothetical protein
MLRSAAASRDQQVRKRDEHGTPTSETALPNRGQRFYLPTSSPLRVVGFAYLRPSPTRAANSARERIRLQEAKLEREGIWKYLRTNPWLP